MICVFKLAVILFMVAGVDEQDRRRPIINILEMEGLVSGGMGVTWFCLARCSIVPSSLLSCSIFSGCLAQR